MSNSSHSCTVHVALKSCVAVRYTQRNNASPSKGESAAAFLHVDLLQLLREKASERDEGGDLFGNLLHLQKHRRGRGLVMLTGAAKAEQLSASTLTQFVVPICLQALLQRGSTTSMFDPNHADVAIRCR